jgi:ribosomal protein L7Ae-like RNA K-turn-binding protein
MSSKRDKKKITNSSSSTNKKKRKLVIPEHLIDNDSLEIIATPIGPIRTFAVSQNDKDIILDRLKKEIIDRFHFTLSPKNSSASKKQKVIPIDDSDKEDQHRKMTAFAKTKIVVGTNSCTRAFEKISRAEISSDLDMVKKDGKNKEAIDFSLCILARDVRPASVLSHIPYLCQLHDIPIVLLGGKASYDLGRLLGCKKTSVLLFKKDSCPEIITGTKKKWEKQIDSLVEFLKSKIPPRQI